jgi:hypothetical protein
MRKLAEVRYPSVKSKRSIRAQRHFNVLSGLTS